MCSEFLHCAAGDQTQSIVYACEGSTTRSCPFNLEFCWRAQGHNSRPLLSTPWMCDCICGLASAWVWAICSLGFHWVPPHKLLWLPQAVPWPRALGPGWKLLVNCPASQAFCPQSLSSSEDVSVSIMSHGKLFLCSRLTETRYLSSSDKGSCVTVLPFKLWCSQGMEMGLCLCGPVPGSPATG